jgi:hypothetical protein
MIKTILLLTTIFITINNQVLALNCYDSRTYDPYGPEINPELTNVFHFRRIKHGPNIGKFNCRVQVEHPKLQNILGPDAHHLGYDLDFASGDANSECYYAKTEDGKKAFVMENDYTKIVLVNLNSMTRPTHQGHVTVKKDGGYINFKCHAYRGYSM